MTHEELLHIASEEMQRDGSLSKGIRIELVAAAKRGLSFRMELSTDDYIRICSELRRSGHSGRMKTRSIGANRRECAFNQPL